jgi:hypothetical protein
VNACLGSLSKGVLYLFGLGVQQVVFEKVEAALAASGLDWGTLD